MTPKQDKMNFSELRRRAEAILTGKAKDSEKAAFDPDEVRHLLHELDTHRIELELQNEDLRHAQEALQKSHRRYADLYDFAPIAYFTLDERAKILEANLTASEMLGMPRGKLIGRFFTDFVAPEDQDVFYRQRKKLMVSRQKLSYDLRLKKKNGEETFHAYVITGASSEDLDPPGQFRLMVSDISHRKAEELEKLRQLKDRYRAIVMDQNEMICRFDPQGRITFVNDAYCRFFQVDAKDVVGTVYLPHVHQDDLPLVRDHFRRLTPDEPVKVIEHRVILANGMVTWQQWSGRALFDEEGNLVECQAVGRDITKLKQVEEKLQHELRLRQLFLDALPCIAILARYPSHEIVAVNREAAAAGAMPGSRCFETYAKKEEQCPWCMAERLWKTGEPQNAQFWAFGLYWDTYWVPVSGDLYLQYSFDITELEKNKQALTKAKEDCERMVAQRTRELQRSHEQLLHSEKLAAVGNLSASIAHEFNNPLQSIMTIIKGIAQYANLEQKELELANLALQECRRMGSLIANLQDFYRPSTGKIEAVNLHELFESLLLMVKKDFNTRKITVVREFADNLPEVFGVVDQLKQVFLNLLNNAADACEGGGTIVITTEPLDRGKVAVNFRDTGVGIAPENLRHIFQPFFTTKAAKRGTGLGLPVSYGIIKKHGGDIRVRSERGSGSLFTVILPINRVENDR